MNNKNKLLTVFSDAEQEALYGLPDFDDAQRLEYLALTDAELALASSRPGMPAQVYCVLQIGYFKAKHAFFRFDWNEVEDDCAFVLSRYFHGEPFERKAVTKHEHYTQRERIAELFGYCLALFDACPFLATMKAPPAPGGQALDKARGRKPRTASRRFRTGEALWAIECRARLQGRSNHPEPSALRRRARASPSAWSRIWYAC